MKYECSRLRRTWGNVKKILFCGYRGSRMKCYVPQVVSLEPLGAENYNVCGVIK